VNALRALLVVFALAGATAALAQPAPSPPPVSTPSPIPNAPGPHNVVGQVLALQDGFLVFTTGDAVRLSPGLALPKGLRLGILVRATLDPVTHAIVGLTTGPKAEPGDLDAAHLPREYAVASPASLRTAPPPAETGAGAGAHGATLTIDLHVPASTPLSDDVYLATDRTNFSPAEIRMQRVDAQRFSTTLQLPVGTQLRYEFTRGSFATIERDRLGGIVTPREITFKADLTTHDSVAGWADVN